jgi:FixJ family two-component response regulator
LALSHRDIGVEPRGCDVEQTTATIVVIDDDDSVRKALRRLMRSAGFMVATYGSAEEFLASRDHSADCLILDVRLPGMSGLDLQRRLTDAGRDPAVILITAHEDPVVRRTGLEAGAVDFIVKPFVRKRLLDAVARAMVRSS